jgi:hypothetical protein
MTNTTNTLRAALTDLATRREQLEHDVSRLAALLDESRQQLQDVTDAGSAIARLLGEESPSGTAQVAFAARSPGKDDPVDPQASSDRVQVKRERTRSADLIVRVVTSAGRPLTRAEIREEFVRQGLVPPGWKNPANAINTALLRAVANGSIRRLEDDTFGPPADATVAQEGTPSWVIDQPARAEVG